MKNIDDVAFVVQARLNSKRLPNKMLKPFCGTSLYEILLEKINSSKIIPPENVYLSVHEKEFKKLNSQYSFNTYNRSEKSANEDNDIRLIYEWWNKIPKKYVVLISACNPLLKIDTIDKFVSEYLNSRDPGMFSVIKKKTYYWDKSGNPITDWQGNKIMNTKIVEPTYEAGHCLYASDISFLKEGNWMDDKCPPCPKLFVVDELETFDIDYPWQFDVGQILYNKFVKEKDTP